MENTGLVLEGGGMRGLYTAGVLEYLLEKELFFPYVIGVSAGACMAASYLSRQKGRNKKVNIEFAAHKEYISFRNFIKKREIFGMDYLFDEIPNKHVPYDYETFYKNTEQFIIGTTDCETGKPVYFGKEEYGENILPVLRASSSLPIIAPIVHFKGRKLLDGGIGNPIPLDKSESDGNQRNVVILTRNRDYQKKKSKFTWYLKKSYPDYPQLIQTISERDKVYNQTLNYISKQEEEGKVFVISPSSQLNVGRIERNPTKLLELYNQGYKDAENQFKDLENWIQTPKNS